MAAYFSPAIVCLDDIDIICGNRYRLPDSRKLAEFLALIDGLNTANVFILATTNDKQWVDFAASRPGRFDMILDFDSFDPSFYMELLWQRCEEKSMLELFTEAVLESLRNRSASGAFVVTLLKQLEIQARLKSRELTADGVLTLIDRLHRGFYKKNSESTVGFKSS